MADNIPTQGRIEELPRRAGGPGTGLSLANENITGAPFRALEDVGGAIGNLAESLFIKAQQHEKQDKTLGQKKMLLDVENQAGAIFNQFQTTESPQEILKLYDEHFDRDPISNIKRLKGLHTIGDDPARIDSKDNVILERYKQLNLSEQDTAEFKLNREGYLNKVENKITALVTKARFDVFKETVGLVDQSIINNIRNGIVDFDDGILSILDNYEDNGYPESVNAPLRESAVQFATMTYLRDQFLQGNTDVIESTINGDFDDELNNVYKEEHIVNNIKKEAVAAKKSIALEVKRKEDEIETIRNRYEKEAHDKFVNEWGVNYDKPTAKTILEIEASTVISGDEKKKMKEVAKAQAKGIDLGLITDPEAERELNSKIRAIDSTTTQEEIEAIEDEIHNRFALGQKGGISRTVRDNLLKKAQNAVMEEEKPFNKQLTTSVNDGRGRILKGSILKGYDAFSTKRANEFENHVEALLKDKPLDVRMRMLTPGTSEYIIDDLIDTYKPSPQEKIADKKRSLADREEGEKIEDYLKRKETKFMKLSDPLRQKASAELKKRGINPTPENIKLTAEYLKRTGRK